ncbi:TetR/AcrR family transcriptional regulator [Actinokineospora soli]|uniref:TetR/AcrR family transcriptional regulator n=1 Tax=Actinokineospora soli TaxID=1048753 RepID=A0ABW2TIZ7_9PSEU
MTATEQPRKRMPRAQRERQMMDVAEEIFSERGYQATSVDEIAERCGVSKPMIYEYFGSKEGLLVACIRAARMELAEATTNAVVGSGSAEEALRKGVLAFFRFADSHRRAWALLLNGEAASAGPVAADEIEKGRQEQAAIDVMLFRAFLPDAPQVMLEAAAQVVVGACERLSLWYVAQDQVDADEAADYLITSLWHGLSGLIERAHPTG